MTPGAPARITRSVVAVLAAVVGAAVLLAVRGPQVAQAAPQAVVVADSLDAGRFLYGRDCVFCHGQDGLGTERGPSLADSGAAGTFYAISTGRMPIAHPEQKVRRNEPRYGEREIDVLTRYVGVLVGGPTIPALDVSGADLATGGDQYRTHCAGCHGATGIGGGLVFGDRAPPLEQSTPAQTAAAIVVGPGTMPSFEAALGDDVGAVVAYVQLLRDPPVRGGVALPAGRVTEGLVAWLVGLIVLGAAVRWIGSRA